MRTNEARLGALLFALALVGCAEPKLHDALQRADGGPPGSPPGGPWSVCADAAVHGVSGDACTFPEGVCMIPNPGPEPESPAGYGETTFWTAAACLSDRQMLIRSERWESTVLGDCARAARRTAEGCIELRECAAVDTWCVPDALLPFGADGPLVELHSRQDCEALREDAEARPGSPCWGEQICYVAFPSAEPRSYDPALVWCHAGRLRFSMTSLFAFDYENVAVVFP